MRKKVYELVIVTTSGQSYSHFFSSKKKAEARQERTRSDWSTEIRVHNLDELY